MSRKIKECPGCNGAGTTDTLGRICELCDGDGKLVSYDATDIVPLEYQDIDTESDIYEDRGRKSDHTEDDDI
jgi:RecJ-like exonuclease